jgi:hypothetical protein
MAEPNLSEKEVWDYIFRPETLESFHEPFPEVTSLTIDVFTTVTGNATETITISPFYGFNTIDDLKLAIYAAKAKDPAFSPSFQFLATPFGEVPSPGSRARKYLATDFYFKSKDVVMPLQEPFAAATAEKLDERFVDSEGNRKILEGASRGRSLFEEIYLLRNFNVEGKLFQKILLALLHYHTMMVYTNHSFSSYFLDLDFFSRC